MIRIADFFSILGISLWCKRVHILFLHFGTLFSGDFLVHMLLLHLRFFIVGLSSVPFSL